MADDTTTTVTPPAVTGGSIADKLVGKAKEATGTVIGDDQLAGEGRLQTAKADAADDAVELAQAAQVRGAKADLTEREQRMQTEQAAVAAEQREEKQLQAVEAKAAADAAKLERESGKRRASVERTRKQRESAADRELFAAAGKRAEIESEADALEAQARREAVRPAAPVVTPVGMRSLPGRVLTGYLHLLQLPVATAARVLRQDASWPPLVVMGGLQAAVKRSAGSLLHDEALRAAGDRTAEDLQRQQAAAELSATAGTKRTLGDRELRTAKARAERKKKAADAAAQEQAAKIQQDLAQARKNAEKAKVTGKSQVKESAAASARARKASERDRTQVALREEAQALQAERAALGKQDEVIRLDEAVDAAKEERRR